MTLLADGRGLHKRFGKYIDRFKRLLLKYGFTNGDRDWLQRFKLAWRDPEFRTEWISAWQQIVEEEGGKLSLATILGIIGAALGAIGIAGFGSAVGLPLVLLSVPVGVLLGNEIDSEGGTKKLVRWFRGLFGSAEDADTNGGDSEASNDIEQKENVADSPNGNGYVANYAEDGLAVLLELLMETSNRCATLEEDTGKAKIIISNLASDVASLSDRFDSSLSRFGAECTRLSDQISSVTTQADVTRLEIGRLAQRTAYLSWGFSIISLALISELVWRFAH